MQPNKRVSKLEYAALLALVASMRSEDPVTKVGAVVFDINWRVLSSGYNGLPKGITLEMAGVENRLSYMIHAEQNALGMVHSQAYRIVCTHSPCPSCLSLIAARGLREVYFIKKYHRYDTTKQANLFGITMSEITLEKGVFSYAQQFIATELVPAEITGGQG
jgi:dCMP deaminase